MANMVHEFFGDLMLVAHTANAPSNAEWDAYIAALKKSDPEKLRTLVFTDGGAPNSVQRKAVNEALGGKTSLGAVVSASVVVRGAVTALSWFNPKIKAFPPEQTREAFRYVGVEDYEVERLWREVHRLRQRLGDDGLKSIARPQSQRPAAR